MDGNPYAGLVALIRGQASDAMPAGDSEQAGLGAAPARMRLGTVVNRVPLKVKVAGLTQPTEVLKINERLVKGAKWKTKTTSPNSDIKDFMGLVHMGGHYKLVLPPGKLHRQLIADTVGPLRADLSRLKKLDNAVHKHVPAFGLLRPVSWAYIFLLISNSSAAVSGEHI